MSWKARLWHDIPIFPAWCMYVGFQSITEARIGAPFNRILNINGRTYVDDHAQSIFSEYIAKRINSQDSYVKDMIAEIRDQLRTFRRDTESIEANHWVEATNAEKIEGINAFVKAFVSLTPYLPAIPTIASLIERRIELELSEHPEDERADLLDHLAQPAESTGIGSFNIDVSAIVQMIVDDPIAIALFENVNSDLIWLKRASDTVEKELRVTSPEIHGALIKLVAEYGWLTMQFGFGDPFNFGDALVKVKYSLDQRKKTKKQRNEGASLTITNSSIEHKPGIDGYSFSSKTEALAHLLPEVVQIRQEKFEEYNRGGLRARNLFLEVSRTVDLSYTDLSYLTPTEVNKILGENRKSNGEESRLAKERKKAFAIELRGPDVIVFSGNDMPIVPENTDPDSINPTTSTLKGRSIIKRGVLSGPARKVLSRDDFGKVQEGDIIVVVATTEDYSIIIDRIAGIVADVGGRTSHMANLAREYNIPTIVNTRFGSLILKDNDLIEIDTDIGLVKRL